MQEGKIAGAGLDVFEQEPVAPDNPLLSDLQRGAGQPVARINPKSGVPADLIRNRRGGAFVGSFRPDWTRRLRAGNGDA